MHIDFYFDVVCPWAYLASTRVDAMAARLGATITWRPILLGGVLRQVGAPDDPNAEHSPARAALGRRDVLRWADRLGVPVSFPPGHPRRSVDAMRLVCLAGEGETRKAVTRALYGAYWEHGRDISDPSVLAEIASAHGLAADGIRSDAMRTELRTRTEDAARAGVFGVPTLRVGDDLVWGLDRMHDLERALGGDPPPEPSPSPTPGPTRVAFFHDFASPFSYLAWTQLDRIASAHAVAIERVPILLGALFRDLGTPDVPLFAMNPTKQAWIGADLERAAAKWGVQFRFPQHFPLRSVLPLRVALVEPATTSAIYDAVWVHDRRVDTPEALEDVLAAAGFHAAALLQAANTGAIKDALRTNTTRARAAGACGVPSWELERNGRRIVLWGQDRIAMLEDVLAGWWPPRD